MGQPLCQLLPSMERQIESGILWATTFAPAPTARRWAGNGCGRGALADMVTGAIGGLLSTIQVGEVEACQPGPVPPRNWYQVATRGRTGITARPSGPVRAVVSAVHDWLRACWYRVTVPVRGKPSEPAQRTN